MRSLPGRVMLTVVAVAVVGAAAPLPVAADETGLAQALHDVRREGRKVCLADHFHDGNSAGLPSRKQAEVTAVQSWAGFTSLEYGSSWGSWAKASSKSMNCSQAGAGWGCSVSARPCK